MRSQTISPINQHKPLTHCIGILFYPSMGTLRSYAPSLASAIQLANAFVPLPPMLPLMCDSLPSGTLQRNHRPTSSSLDSLPFSEVWDSSSNDASQEAFMDLVPKLGCRGLDSNGALISKDANGTMVDYKLYLATDIDDLPPVTHLTLEVFDATAITLSSTSDWSAFEKAVVDAVVQPAISAYNSYANVIGYIEVLSGLRRRLSQVIVNGDSTMLLSPIVYPDGSCKLLTTPNQFTLEELAAASSLILVLARNTVDGNLEAAASVELRLQPTDAKIPFSQPWLDNIERRLVRSFPFVSKSKTGAKPPLRPYLCNLCVTESLRNLGIGRALCRIVEAIANQQWGYDHIYLHVDPENAVARTLYEREGYKDVGRRWTALWTGEAGCIGYYTKKLK